MLLCAATEYRFLMNARESKAHRERERGHRYLMRNIYGFALYFDDIFFK